MSLLKARSAILLLLTIVIAQQPGYCSEESGIPSGSVELGGSVALADLVTDWISGFQKRYPGIRVTLADSGSESGIATLINGSKDAVLIGTPITAEQQSGFAQRYGYPPRLIPVAMDGVAVYVNKLNPLRQVTLAQLDAVFSATRRCSASPPITTWGQLGVAGELKSQPVKPYGLDVSSGAYQLFRTIALCDGDFSQDFQAMAGPGALEAAVASQSGAMGFSSSTLGSAALRPLAVARDAGSLALLPDAANIRSKSYPLSRTLAIAVNLPPEASLPPALGAFLDYVRSAQGQQVAAKRGYVTL